MKALVGVALVVMVASFLAAAQTKGAKSANLHEQTRKDLDTALHGEAFAHGKYLLYAEHAHKSGQEELAKLFESAARTEHSEHFAAEAQLAKLVRSNADNLRDAIQGESYEAETMYPEFARRAEAVGDKAAAARFEEIGKDEMKHRDNFKAALESMQGQGVGGH